MKDVSGTIKTTASVIKSGFKSASPELQVERLDICGNCTNFDGKSCQLCGCNMSIKVKFSATKCPDGLW